MAARLNFRTVLLSRKGPVARLTLNRPRAENRVNQAMALELAQAVQTINQDESVRVVVLAGRGQAFSAGWERLRVRSAGELAPYQAASSIALIQRPVVASLNGDAVGQGLEVALAADIRIASTTARFSMPQLQYGILPWDGGTQRLPRLVGRAHALSLLLTGVMIDAAEALRIGLVSRVVDPAALDDATDEVVGQIAAGAPIAAQYAKETVAKGMDMPLDQALRLEADLNILLHATRDRREGIRSFRERRPPRFRGR